MTETRYDRAPGDRLGRVDIAEGTSSGAFVATIGLFLAVILTATSFWVANTSLLWAPGISLGLAVLAIAQMGIHLVFFLHITTGPDNTNNVLALAFGVLIVTVVVAGSLWIMTNLNDSMMPRGADEFAYAALTGFAAGAPLGDQLTMSRGNMLTLQSRLRWAISLPKTPRLMDALTAARAPLLFGVRLWASVCLALFVAFWLELDNPFWAGTSAAIVCQPQLGASLRKGWFRMIGTVVGATMIVVLTAWFPQDRIAFLVLLALWGGICAFVGSVLRNFASYSAALAGYTAAIIAADNLGATGGPSADVFLLAVWRASEICIGIACAGIVLAGTDLGGARRRLAASFASLAAEITSRFTRMLALAGPQLPDTQTERRELVRRVIALDPMIDQALGESSYVRYRSSMLAERRPRPVQSVGWLARRCDTSESFGRCRRSAAVRKPFCAAFRPSCDQCVSRPRRHAGSLIPWPCDAPARTRCGDCLPCRPTSHRCGCSPTRRPRCWPE